MPLGFPGIDIAIIFNTFLCSLFSLTPTVQSWSQGGFSLLRMAILETFSIFECITPKNGSESLGIYQSGEVFSQDIHVHILYIICICMYMYMHMNMYMYLYMYMYT